MLELDTGVEIYFNTLNFIKIINLPTSYKNKSLIVMY